ncbi:MAG: phosphate transport system permease protein [Parasphingorhabdus sp.]|jgi:phosphate transport system permease protein|nr:MAG: Phosphate transport system permease protein PstC 2 [Porticoccaceae bacterium UBA1117]|tara:strand:- start:5923 stop:7203 length:1281 start_codon:yes stop_codon:yes gene_type:complete
MTESINHLEKIKNSLSRRNRAEKRFRWYGRTAIFIGLAAVLVLFTDIVNKGHGAFRITYIELEVTYDQDRIGVNNLTDPKELTRGNWEALSKTALRTEFPAVSGRSDKRELYGLISSGAGFDLKDRLLENPRLLGETERVWLLADDDIDTYYKSWLDGDTYSARMSAKQLEWIDELHQQGKIRLQFNSNLFTRGDSREPEQAGIRGAVMGSLLTLILTLLLSFPIGVSAAIYLEEFAPRNRWTDFIEVNINNLAAVPSIIFGLLGLAIFINFFHVPRSVPIVGGLVLTLMTLPTIIITSRAAIKSVPPSIREAALGMGASKYQTVLHHVLPLSLPGMLTGAIIGMAQALGESAPLLMIGMVAFIVDIPGGFSDPATVLPVQIFLWADSPERAFIEKTSAAIMILLSFLIVMNTVAVWLRKRLERRW